MNVRDLVFGIAWKINDTPLRKADKQTDEFKRSVGDLENEIGSVGSEGKRSFGKIERSANEADGSIRSIQDPNISGRQPVSELGDVGQEADQTRGKIKSIPDPHIDGSQARDELQKTEEEADQLSDKLKNIGGAIGGAVGGGAVGGDILNFSQIPREFEASLGVTREKAEGLAKETEDIFVNVKDITTTEATESVLTAARTFDVVGEKAGDLGTNIALLQKQTGADISRIARTANLLDKRFEDIEGPQQAFNMLTEASQRLNPDVFDELLDNTEEYSNNISKAGMRGNDFFSAMVDGGEKGIRVMDRMGDSLAFEFIGRIKEGDDTVMDSLSAVVAKTEGLGNVTLGTIDEYGKLTDKIQSLKSKGEEVPEDLQNRMNELSQSVKPAIEQTQELRKSIIEGGPEGKEALDTLISGFSDLPKEIKAAHGTNIFGTMYEEQGEEFMPILQQAAQGYEEIGASAEGMQKRNEGAFNEAKKVWKEARTKLGSVGDAFGGVGEIIGGMLPAIGAFVGSGGLGTVGKATKGAGKGVKWLGNKFDDFGRKVWNTGKSSSRGVGRMGSRIGRTFSTIKSKAGSMTRTVGSKFGSLGRSAWNTGKTVGRNAGKMGSKIGKFAGTAGKYLFSAGKSTLKFGGKILGAAGKVAKFGWRIGKLFTPIGWLITLAIDVGDTIVSNWDKITSASGEAETAIGGFFKGMWMTGKLYINKMIGRVNWLIEKINLIPKVDIPNIGKLNTMTTGAAQKSGLSPMAYGRGEEETNAPRTMGIMGTHADGLYNVPYDDYVANLHKGESVLTADQSDVLRDTGILSDQGDKPKLNLKQPNPDQVHQEWVTNFNNSQENHQSAEHNEPKQYNNESAHVKYSPNFYIYGDNNDENKIYKLAKKASDQALEEFLDMMSRKYPRVTEG